MRPASAAPKGAAAKVSAGRRRNKRGVHDRQRARTERNKIAQIRRELRKGGATYFATNFTGRGLRAPNVRPKGPFAPGYTVLQKSGGYTIIPQ